MLRQTGTYVGAAAFTLLLSLAILATGQQIGADDRLVVHEWGTFTSLQDEQGGAIGGINADDEPVPEFVHRVSHNLVLGPRTAFNYFAKSVPRTHPDVTMRLETPVVYFHPAHSSSKPLRIDIEVGFRQGWLSEFYPQAEVDAPGLKDAKTIGPITPATVGRLMWKDLEVGTDAAGPETKSPVWLAPRAAAAANVTAAGGESERFLFYRGVGRVDSPLRVSRDEERESLKITAGFPVIPAGEDIEFIVPAMWLVEIGRDKSCAFRRLEGFRVANDGRPRDVTMVSADFEESQFHADNTEDLSLAIRTALVDDGLFPDEADALLATWKASYFENPGLRLFYLLPREWTDHVMPMKLSVEAKLVRTMIGRVEIVTPQQRQLLSQIAAGPASSREALQLSAFSCAAPSPEPPDYRDFQELGRFRNALVLDELKRRPTEALKSFVDGYGLHGYAPATPAPAP